MAKLSDSIENFLKAMLDQTDYDTLEIQRNELAGQFQCAPSQINYVISTRFSPENGYVVESTRGGGGCIRICRVQIADLSDDFLMQIANSLGESLTQHQAGIYIKNIAERELITEREAALFETAISDQSLAGLDPRSRDILRSSLFKKMILTLISTKA